MVELFGTCPSWVEHKGEDDDSGFLNEEIRRTKWDQFEESSDCLLHGVFEKGEGKKNSKGIFQETYT